MTKNRCNEAVEAFARLNPVPAAEVATLASARERDRTYARVVARLDEPARASSGTRRGRAAAAAIAVAVALALPALALSGALGSLFGFSNEGANVDSRTLDLQTASALDITGAARATLKLLASRDGVGIYAAGNGRGGLCYFIGPPGRPDERGVSGGCLNRASTRFPSPEAPVVDMTAFSYRPRAVGEQVTRLAGVAADGVATVQVIDGDCKVIAEAPVIDNVYVNANVPDEPAVAIEALGANGERVYLEKLRFWDTSACANASNRR